MRYRYHTLNGKTEITEYEYPSNVYTYINGEIRPYFFMGKKIGEYYVANEYEIAYSISTENRNSLQGNQEYQDILAKVTKEVKEDWDTDTDPHRFPLCCDFHRARINPDNFNGSYLLMLRESTAQKILSTKDFIKKYIDDELWYKLITDYIDLAIESFGRIPSGCGDPHYIPIYFRHTLNFIRESSDIRQEKQDKLWDFIAIENNKFLSKEDQSFDSEATYQIFNKAIKTYENWINYFPFEISFFKGLKEKFLEDAPLWLTMGNIDFNIVSQTISGSFNSAESLIEKLINLTNDLLIKINGAALLEAGEITDFGSVQIELIKQERKQELKEGYKNSSPNEDQRIRKMIKSWLKDERKFWSRITPLFSTNTPVLKPKADIQEPDEILNVFCKSMEIAIPKEHFRVFVEQNSVNKNPFLTEAQLDIFIRKAFLGKKELSKQKFNVGNREKLFIVKRFYEFYTLAIGNDYENTSQCQPKYIKLLTDNFSNWDYIDIKNNFGNKVKRDW